MSCQSLQNSGHIHAHRIKNVASSNTRKLPLSLLWGFRELKWFWSILRHGIGYRIRSIWF
jgi:hypothetical protein